MLGGASSSVMVCPKAYQRRLPQASVWMRNDCCSLATKGSFAGWLSSRSQKQPATSPQHPAQDDAPLPLHWFVNTLRRVFKPDIEKQDRNRGARFMDMRSDAMSLL